MKLRVGWTLAMDIHESSHLYGISPRSRTRATGGNDNQEAHRNKEGANVLSQEDRNAKISVVQGSSSSALGISPRSFTCPNGYFSSWHSY